MIGPKEQRTCRYGFRYNGQHIAASPNNGNFLHHRIYAAVAIPPLGLPQFLTIAAARLVSSMYYLMSDCIEVKRLLLKQNALVYKKLITKRDNLLRFLSYTNS